MGSRKGKVPRAKSLMKRIPSAGKGMRARKATRKSRKKK